MEKGIDSQIILRCFLKKILIGFSRKGKISQNDISLIKKYFIFGMFQHTTCATFGSLILSGDEVVSLFFVIKKIVYYVVFFNSGVDTISVQLDILGESFDIWVITTDNNSSMIIVLIHFHKTFNFV